MKSIVPVISRAVLAGAFATGAVAAAGGAAAQEDPVAQRAIEGSLL